MLPIPPPLRAQFEDRLRKNAIPKQNHGSFKKWLSYYLDFCEKYHFPATRKESLPEFLGKLREKRQTKTQREQAACEIGMFYEVKAYNRKDVKQGSVHETSSKHSSAPDASSENPQLPKRAFQQETSHNDRVRRSSGSVTAPMTTSPPRHAVGSAEKKRAEKTDGSSAVASARTISGRGASWEAEYAALANEIEVRHYSPKTLNTYRGWVRRFQAFTKSKPPPRLATDDVKEFLTFLAVKRKVASSTQNQAFNALLFFFR